MFQTSIPLQMEQDEDDNHFDIGQGWCAILFPDGFAAVSRYILSSGRKKLAEIVGKTIYFRQLCTAPKTPLFTCQISLLHFVEFTLK